MERPPEHPPLPDPRPIHQREGISWRVLTPTTLPEGDDWVFFGVTPQDYEDMSLNQADILRFVEEAKWRLRYYTGKLGPDEEVDDGSGD